MLSIVTEIECDMYSSSIVIERNVSAYYTLQIFAKTGQAGCSTLFCTFLSVRMLHEHVVLKCC